MSRFQSPSPKNLGTQNGFYAQQHTVRQGIDLFEASQFWYSVFKIVETLAISNTDALILQSKWKSIKRTQLETHTLNKHIFLGWLKQLHTDVLESNLPPPYEAELVNMIAEKYDKTSDPTAPNFLDAIDLPQQQAQFDEHMKKMGVLERIFKGHEKFNTAYLQRLVSSTTTKYSREVMIFELDSAISVILYLRICCSSTESEKKLLTTYEKVLLDFRERVESREPKFTAERGVKLQSIAE